MAAFAGSAAKAAPPTLFRAENLDYMSVDLRWRDNSSFGDLQILQRKKATESEFKTIVRFPHKADFYVDLGLESNTSYNYRLGTRERGGMSAWTNLTTKSTINTHTAVFNVKDFGAKGNGTSNDTGPIRQALKEALKEGGTVFFPAGTYAVAPDPAGGSVFYVEGSNIFFKGEGPEKSIISCYVSGLRNPETNWDYRSDGFLIRGSAFLLNMDNQTWNKNFVFEGLRVTGNARPTGDTAWWTNEQREYGWDTTHKGIYLGLKNGNVYMKNCVWDNFRGEIIYSGDAWTKKLKMVDCKVYGTNSSAISTAADFEAVNIDVWDAANTCVESAFFYNFNGQPSPQQNCVIINSRFRARSTMLTDTNANPILRNTESGKSDLAVFNSPGSYMVVDGCRLETSKEWGILMEAGQRNFTVIDTTFEDCGINGFIYFETKNKADYKLTGTVENFLVEGSTFIANRSAFIWATANYHPMPQKDILFRNNYVELRGGESIVHIDAHPWDGLRDNFVFDGNKVVENGGKLQRFTFDVKLSAKPAIKPIWKSNNEFPIPTYFETGGQTQFVSYSAQSDPTALVVQGPYMKIHDLPANTVTEFEMNSNKDRYPEGFRTEFIRTSKSGSALMRRNTQWNDFPKDITLEMGNSMIIQKQDYIFRLKELNGKKILSFRDKGFSFADTEEGGRTYAYFTGVSEGQVVTVHINTSGVTLESNQNIKLSNNQSFVSSDSPIEIKLVRNGDSLIEVERLSCQRSLVSIE